VHGRNKSEGFELDRLREGIAPFRLHYFPSLKSTNTHAATLRKRGTLFAPAIVLTTRQTAGRGRGSNTWASPAGNLTVTFAMPVQGHLPAHQLPLVAGLAVRHAAAELLGSDDVKLKWPNDLVVTNRSEIRKLAGLLSERVENLDLIGLGFNVNLNPAKAPKELRDRLTSLRALAGHEFDLTNVLIAIAVRLRTTLGARDSTLFPAFLTEYDRHHALVGRRVSIVSEAETVTGTVAGLDDTGRLLVRERSGILHRVIAGHVVLAR
jgi:BirA family biotin operon repressor/biotin-[acetyl-CoA-carboxylase] ligase